VGRDLVNMVVSMLDDASLYALLGTGFVILFRCTGVINFAQGAFMALSGYVYLIFAERSVPWPLALLLTVIVMGLVGGMLHLIAFRRLVGASLFSLVIATLGLATVVTVLMNVLWGPAVRSLTAPFSGNPVFSLAGSPVLPVDLYTVGVALVFVPAAAALLQLTRLGTRMRAVADSPLLAGLARVNVHRVSALAWGIAGGLTAVAGVSFALRSAIDPVSAQGYGLVAFAAVLIGGLDSLRGAVLGGFLLALIQAVVVQIWGPQWAQPVAYVALVLVLFLRPQGVFGSPAVVRL
jgi:branched-chain amino acid transport system permease protein